MLFYKTIKPFSDSEAACDAPEMHANIDKFNCSELLSSYNSSARLSIASVKF
jgi:hypothetical protein